MRAVCRGSSVAYKSKCDLPCNTCIRLQMLKAFLVLVILAQPWLWWIVGLLHAFASSRRGESEKSGMEERLQEDRDELILFRALLHPQNSEVGQLAFQSLKQLKTWVGVNAGTACTVEIRLLARMAAPQARDGDDVGNRDTKCRS